MLGSGPGWLGVVVGCNAAGCNRRQWGLSQQLVRVNCGLSYTTVQATIALHNRAKRDCGLQFINAHNGQQKLNVRRKKEGVKQFGRPPYMKVMSVEVATESVRAGTHSKS